MSGATIRLAVVTDADLVAEVTRKWATDQIPFAAAVALTRVAQDVKAEEVADAPRRIRIRSKWVYRSFRVRSARKDDWPRIHAQVGSVFEPLALQEFGGIKRPRTGEHVAIPARFVDVRRSPTTGRFPRGLLPRVLKKGRKVGRTIRAPRKASGKTEDAIFWILARRVRIPARLQFRVVAERVATSTYERHFTRELEAAIRSRRVQGGSFSSEAGRLSYLRARARVELGQ